MQTVSSTWKQLFQDYNHITEVKIVIGDTEYGMDDLYAVNQDRTLFTGGVPEIGACVASSLSFDIIPKSKVARMAEVVVYNRISSWDKASTSEWIAAGTYYIDTRAKTDDGEKMRFTAYDAMLKADQPYLENSELSSWPSSDDDVADEIADLMGIEVDSRTVLAGYDVPIPDQDWTAREVLGWIAAANGGNWVITPENKLLLVKFEGITSLLGTDSSHALLLGDSLIMLSTGIKYEDTRDLLGENDTTAIKFGNDFVVMNVNRNRDGGYYPTDGQDIQKNAHSLQNLGLLQPFTGVKLWRSHEVTYEEQMITETAGNAIQTYPVQVEIEQSVMAGTDDGRVLEADCPWATQAMATAILAQIDGYCWQGAVVEGAEITPAAELGDPVICDGVAFPLSSVNVTYDGGYAPTISAPADEEVDYEYHYESETERQISRKVSLGENYYGFKVTRENGIEITNIVDGAETTRMILNSNIQAFYNANGVKALYFDTQAGKYKFRGDVVVTEGSLVISSAFAIFPNGTTEVEAEAETVPDGFTLYNRVDNALYKFLNIYAISEYTHFASAADSIAEWDFPVTHFNHSVDFVDGNVTISGRGYQLAEDSLVATIGDVKRLIQA